MSNTIHGMFTIHYTEAAIKETVQILARDLDSEYYSDPRKPVVVVPVMKAALWFAADLSMAMKTSCDVETYDPLIPSLFPNVEGRTVLIVDVIRETGNTLERAHYTADQNEATRVDTCVLLDRESAPPLYHSDHHWWGYKVPNNFFFVGYGLDHKGLYRNIPFIAALGVQDFTPEDYTRRAVTKSRV